MRKLIGWDDLKKVLARLGYEEQKPRQKGGSAVPFRLPDGSVRSFHRPHGGISLRAKTMAKRLGLSYEQFMELL